MPGMSAVRRVLAPNPGPMTLEGTNTWIVGDDPAVVIDPGPDDAGHLGAARAEAGAIGAIVLTHRHPDHAPGAAALARASGAPIYAWRPDPGELPLRAGQELVAGGGLTVVAVHTPGHTPDHVVFFVPTLGALFTGDAVLGRGTSVIDPPEGDLAAYLRSLDAMAALAPRTIYPGHGA
jgi:glyoxylase-like metal-dependent hydrolase (beta-lactamase superfamily II)